MTEGMKWRSTVIHITEDVEVSLEIPEGVSPPEPPMFRSGLRKARNFKIKLSKSEGIHRPLTMEEIAALIQAEEYRAMLRTISTALGGFSQMIANNAYETMAARFQDEHPGV